MDAAEFTDDLKVGCEAGRRRTGGAGAGPMCPMCPPPMILDGSHLQPEWGYRTHIERIYVPESCAF